MKSQKRKLYIVPGFGESTRMKGYRQLSKEAENSDFEVVPVQIDWDTEKTMTDYVREASDQLQLGTEHDTVLGFSFGAFIAYVLAGNTSFSRYIFATISPYFRECLEEIPKESKEYFGARFIESLSLYSLHAGVDSEAFFLVGEKDWDLVKEVNKKAADMWKGEGVYMGISNAGHELEHSNYSAALKGVLKENPRS